MMASINLVMVSQSNIFNRDFVIDHKLSVELWSSEFLDQSDTYNLCFLNIAFTVRKCPSHICNDFSFNYTNAFVWMRHTLDWHKWTCSRKAKTAPEHLLAMFYITHWYGQDFTAHPFDPDKSTVLPLNEKMTFIWKQHFFTVFLQSNFMFFFVIIFPVSFCWVRSCFSVVSKPFCPPPVGGVASVLEHMWTPACIKSFCKSKLVFRAHFLLFSTAVWIQS